MKHLCCYNQRILSCNQFRKCKLKVALTATISLKAGIKKNIFIKLV